MSAIKISSKVDEVAWSELRELARESNQSISGVLSEAIREYIVRKRIRPVVMGHLDDSIADNQRLGRLLAE